MFEPLRHLNPVLLALIAGIFTWSITALGAASVFTVKSFSQRLTDVMLGFAAGVMMAASVWSLLIPSIEISQQLHYIKWIPPLVGFLSGAAFLRLLDRLMPHLHIGFDSPEGIPTKLNKQWLLVLAITLHNIPEGLAVGVAFGSLAANLSAQSFEGAIALAIGIAIQNFPEGIAVALPLRGMGISRNKAFHLGHLSALVEPLFAVIGASLVFIFLPILPYALSFAAGAMIYVVVEEVIPESQRNGNTDIATISTIIGFAVMMLLDVAL
ncbi:TPA: ZIP family metal transporter [candidate division WOR-3 bacterium]|jgi:ZIP family zinc transporter|uniref:ZIP family metal transporter n=1 Tax=candidate division WOR-3 bacterium TaxID=2052148 RepID=A0A350HA02_UNCW3|nr:ZIP family metal transporter [candidate division WOR-3 bacterium]